MNLLQRSRARIQLATRVFRSAVQYRRKKITNLQRCERLSKQLYNELRDLEMLAVRNGMDTDDDTFHDLSREANRITNHIGSVITRSTDY